MIDTATAIVAAEPGRIREVLLDPAAMPGWNPALLSLTGTGEAVLDHPYPVVVRGGLRGHMTYRRIQDDQIDIDYRVRLLGLEEGTWILEVVDPDHTRVRHTFKHEGFAGGLTAGIFRGVAGLRVGRLVDLFANN
jgi:polyketide cyclase/dehydrase/lipid transport protein